MEWGTKDRLEFLERMEESGKEPKALENRPEVPEYLVVYLEAFFRLSDRRTYGFSAPNPISFSDIRAYLDIYPTHDIDLFMYLMTEMDSEYIDSKTKKTVTKANG